MRTAESLQLVDSVVSYGIAIIIIIYRLVYRLHSCVCVCVWVGVSVSVCLGGW